jgi:hypothetical protein
MILGDVRQADYDQANHAQQLQESPDSHVGYLLPKILNSKYRVGGLATSDKTTIVIEPIVIERQPDGKMRVTSGSWDGEKVFLKDQVLEVRHAIADSRLHVARKTKAPDEWDPPVPVYDPYGPGTSSDEFTDD